jgi:hypothetical protein
VGNLDQSARSRPAEREVARWTDQGHFLPPSKSVRYRPRRARDEAYLHSAIALARGRELREMMELPFMDWRPALFMNPAHANSNKHRR